jgi:membrane protease YdiL (CAAX protease family)
LQNPQDISLEPQVVETLQEQPVISRSVAPVWHTVLLVAAIIGLSIQGASELSGKQPEASRLGTYASTVISELLMVAWVYLGLKLRKISFRSLLGSVRWDFRSIAIDLGFAMAFWTGSLVVLGTIGLSWSVFEAAIKHQPLIQAGKQVTPDASQQQALHALTALVPTNGREVAAWVLLCMVAGFAEEVVFRGYFQRQFTAWSRGTVAAGVVFSALLFGSAHGYQGVRNMVMLSVFGALFSLLALFRRSLRAGIIAHGWHDLIAGLTLALLKLHHLI